MQDLIQMFSDITNWAGQMSAVQVDTGTRKESIYQVVSQCDKMVEQLMKYESTQFMVAPILEHYFNMILPAITIPVAELLNGDTKRLDECKLFAQKLKEHPVHQLWAERAEIFKTIAEQAGFPFECSDYKNLALIAPIVSNAITALDTYPSNRIYQVREGNFADTKPALMQEIAIFRNLTEAVHLYEKYAPPAFIGFVGIEQTYGETNHDFDDWLCGANSRKANVMRYDHLSEKEYETTIDPHSRKIYCIAKNGENIWLFQPPMEESQMENVISANTFINYYGRRATYAPIQIFFKNISVPDQTNALIPYKQRKWLLKDILDEEQKIWLPIFFYTIETAFFGEKKPMCFKALLPEETQMVLALPSGNTKQTLPAVVHTSMNIPTPEELFMRDDIIDEDGKTGQWIDKEADVMFRNALTMMKWLGITSADIMTAPIGFRNMVSAEDAKALVEQQTVAAYYKVIRDKLLEESCAQMHRDAQQWYHNHIDVDCLIEDINTGIVNATITVDKTQIINNEGTPVLMRTNMDDGHELRNIGVVHEYREWFPRTLIDKHPPVVVKVRPKTPEEIAAVTHGAEDMPNALRYINVVEAFCRKIRGTHYSKLPILNTTITLIFSKTEYKKRFK